MTRNRSEFDAEQYDLVYPDGAEAHWWHVARNAIIHRAWQRLGNREGRVLDVGCGRGIVVRFLRDRGVRCEGVDLGASLPMPGAERWIRTGVSVFDLPEEERRGVTTLLFLDVIEHLEDPIAFLREVLSSFPDVSSLIVTVPAREELWSAFDDFYGHHRRYTLRDIDTLAKSIGARGATRSYFFRALYPVMRLTASMKVKRSLQLIAPSRTTRWMHRLVGSFFVAEELILPGTLPGASIIATFDVAARAAAAEQ